MSRDSDLEKAQNKIREIERIIGWPSGCALSGVKAIKRALTSLSKGLGNPTICTNSSIEEGLVDFALAKVRRMEQDLEGWPEEVMDALAETSRDGEDCLSACRRVARERNDLFEQVQSLKLWVEDLQSGTYVNCVYCGHRYGPSDEVPVSMAEILKEHIEECPAHPMSKMKEDLKRVESENKALRVLIGNVEFAGDVGHHLKLKVTPATWKAIQQILQSKEGNGE